MELKEINSRGSLGGVFQDGSLKDREAERKQERDPKHTDLGQADSWWWKWVRHLGWERPSAAGSLTHYNTAAHILRSVLPGVLITPCVNALPSSVSWWCKPCSLIQIPAGARHLKYVESMACCLIALGRSFNLSELIWSWCTHSSDCCKYPRDNPHWFAVRRKGPCRPVPPKHSVLTESCQANIRSITSYKIWKDVIRPWARMIFHLKSRLQPQYPNSWNPGPHHYFSLIVMRTPGELIQLLKLLHPKFTITLLDTWAGHCFSLSLL